MPMKSLKPVVAAVAFASLLVACQEKQQLKEMHDNTEQMNATTAKMSATTDQLLAKTGSVESTTTKVADVSEKMNGKMTDIVSNSQSTLSLMSELYDSGRQGAALDLRMKIWKEIVEQEDLGAKVVNSGEYFLAFEFELWSGLGQDQNPTRRDLLARDAVKEFFNHVKIVSGWSAKDSNAFAQPGSRVKSGEYFVTTETLNQKAVFNALSAALHQTNRKQEFSADRNSLEVLSMYSLIEKSLRAGAQIKLGEKKLEDFPLYVNEVLKSEKLAIRLMQARYSMLGLVLLGRVTDIGWDLGTGARLKIFGSPWTLDLSHFNQSEIRFFRAHLTEAQKAKTLLQDLKMPVVLDPSLKKIYANARVLDVDPTIAEASLSLDVKDFSQALKEYLK